MKKTILIVDDEPAIVAALQRVLRNREFNILTANSGHEALKIMQHREVSVVLTDYQMPQLNGLQLLAQIAVKWPQSKRLMLTGNNHSSEVLKSEVPTTSTQSVSDELAKEFNTGKETEYGPDIIHQVLSKPWSNEQLILAIERAFNSEIKLAVKTSAKENSQATSQNDYQIANNSQILTIESVELINYRAIEQLVVDVSEIDFPELACLFIESTGQRLKQLEQVDKQCCKSAITNEVRLQLHTLASSMALYGLEHSAQCAKYLENATDSEINQHLNVFCKQARKSLLAFNQQLIKRAQNEI